MPKAGDVSTESDAELAGAELELELEDGMKLDTRQAAAMRERLLGKLENENRAMLRVIEHVPEESLDFKPHDKLRPFNELATHVYNVGMWFVDTVEKGQMDLAPAAARPPAPLSKATLLQTCQQMGQEIVRRISDLPEPALVRDIDFARLGTYQGVTYVDWHLSHLIHHRAQLALYLRMMGAKVPAIYVDSLDYPMQL